ncbi:metallophosphoesterase [Azotosporobacter soli]|uniref:metallophosphoesterase n=1 Tax=Azotosporobacter soli TaxID=3055040 RepID=UPI0031FE7A64
MGTINVMSIVFFCLIGAINIRLLYFLGDKRISSRTAWYYGVATLTAAFLLQPIWLAQPRIITSVFDEILPPLVCAAVVWLSGQLFLLPIFTALCLLASATKKCGTEVAVNSLRISRRAFLQGSVLGAPLLAFGMGGKAVYEAMREMTLQQLTVAFPDLPVTLDGFVIAQISDAHLGPYFSLARLDETLALVAQAKPDMLVITGDLIGDMALLRQGVKKISDLAAGLKQKVYFCWGNHEYYHRIDEVRAELEEAGIVILENESCHIKVGEGELYLAGVDYPRGHKKEVEEKRLPFLEAALAEIPENTFHVLLAHHPDFLKEAFVKRVPLTLAGHTHGGQVKLFGRYLINFGYRYLAGLYQEGRSYGYVHTGTGQWLPLRVNCPPQVSLITLRKEG